MEDKRLRENSTRRQPKMLSDRYHQILRLHLLGYKNREIAVRLGIAESTVSIALNSNLGRCYSAMQRAELDGTAIEAAREIRNLAAKAVKLIEGVMESEEAPASVRLRAAQDILDRAGFSAPKQREIEASPVSLTTEELDELKRMAVERAQESGLIIEAEPVTMPTSVVVAQ